MPSDSVPEDMLSAEAQGLSDKSLSPRQMAWRRFRSHKPAMVCTGVLILMVVFVLAAPITARYGVNEAVFKTEGGVSNRYLSPRSIAWFGTDEIGRDLYSRLIYGTRCHWRSAWRPPSSASWPGTAVGAWAGIRGGLFDDILMRVTDIFLAFPFLVALLVTRNMLGRDPVAGADRRLEDVDPLHDPAPRAVRLDGCRPRRAGPGPRPQGT
jgi:peptide/nickel transport system permease protein